ncbi:phage tail protein [Parasalinivibrio latis]|uniref:phage tail-collar fiber domain-containing protein n=1 Tax=Parasalinivibrio latis TaxID=2952610 RepID=UPI0030DF1923
MANLTDTKIVTAAGKSLLAELNALEKPLVIDKMIYANVPNREPLPQPGDGVPVDYIVHEAGVDSRGRLSADSVIYTCTLASNVGPFEFNWTGAYCSEFDVLVVIDHHPMTPKTVDQPGIAGNTLVRSVVLEYKDIAEITNITVDAQSWQYDSTRRMKRMDDDTAQSNMDLNGKDWFIEDGFLVTPAPTAGSYSVAPGRGYISGRPVEMEFPRIINVATKPSFVYLDGWREGTPTGEQYTEFNLVISSEELDDYTTTNAGRDVPHFVCKIAEVLADGTVVDLRSDGEQASKAFAVDVSAKQLNAKIWPVTGHDTKVGDTISYAANALWINGSVRTTDKEIPAGAVINVINELGNLVTASGVQYKLGGALDNATVSVDGISVRTLAAQQSHSIRLANDFSLIGDDATDNKQRLVEILAMGDKTPILFRSGKYVIDGDLAIDDVPLIFECGAQLVSTSGVLSINTPVYATSQPASKRETGRVDINGIDLFVGATKQFKKIQDAIDKIPAYQWQRFNVIIDDGTYNEDVFINNLWAAGTTTGAVSGERAGVYISGASKAGVKVKSVLAASCGGAAFHPMISRCTITGWNTKTNEKASVEFYGCPSGAVLDVDFSASGADKALVSYGSKVSAETVSFGDRLYNDLFVTKHGGEIYSNDNTRLGIGSSPEGTAKRYISNPVGGQIFIADSSGLFSEQFGRIRHAGAMSGYTYDTASQALHGPKLLADHIAAYQTYFTSLTDFRTISIGNESVAEIDDDRGLAMTCGNATGHYIQTLVRRTNTVHGHNINNQQQLLAAIEFNSMDGAFFEIGIGEGVGQPRVYIEVTATTVRGIVQKSDGTKTNVHICNTAEIAGDKCTFDIMIERDNTSSSTQNGLVRFRISTDKEERFKQMKLIQEAAETSFHWVSKVESVDGTKQTVFIGELRLYRS